MMEIAITLIIISIIIYIYSMIRRNLIFDKIICLNIICTTIISFVALFAAKVNEDFIIDIAIIYGLISFIVTIAFRKYLKYDK